MDKIAFKLQERLVQTCIDFINEYKDDEQVKEIEMVDFTVDHLQESAEHNAWLSGTDSYCGLYGIKPESWSPIDLNEGYLIDESY